MTTHFEAPLVMIADDDRMVRFMVSQMLGKDGIAVCEAENGREAVGVFREHRPDIVLLDVMMPEQDGFTTCEVLRSLPEGEHVPVIMVTGLEDVESIRKAYEVGATDFITKPINWVILGQRIRYMWRVSLMSHRLRESEENKRALLDAIPDMMFKLHEDGTIMDFKAPNDSRLSLSSWEIIGKPVNEVLFMEAPQQAGARISRVLENGSTQIFEHRSQLGGEWRHYESRIVRSGDRGALAMVRDVTERKEADEQIVHLAYHDNLTGLLNRHRFREHLSQAISHAERYGGLLAVLFLDLDRFKRINDTLGHNTGDLLLQSVAERLQESARGKDFFAKTNPGQGGSLMSRLGGDEFVVLLTEIDHIQDAAKVARRILDSLSRPFQLSEHEIFISASLGIAIYPADGQDADTIIKNADAAMYCAKDQGRNNFQFYTESMNAAAFERLSLENSLRKALHRGEFCLHYQPQLDTHSGKIVAVEALIRWHHPDLGLVPPGDFIPLAEETGLIVPVGAWVLQAACEQIRQWQKMGLPPLRMTVNISSRQFRQNDLVKNVSHALETSGLDPKCLELELTESAIMHNTDLAISMLRKLKLKGIRIALDDFGTGYSSLSYLKRFPIDVVKIDRSFVRGLNKDADDEAITLAIIAMARSLNLKVVAEGVETKEQLTFLREHNCDLVQGYYYSPAVPAEAIEALFSSPDSGSTQSE